MASITVTNVTLRLSKLVKDGSTDTITLPEEMTESLEAYASEVISDPSVLVEIVISEE